MKNQHLYAISHPKYIAIIINYSTIYLTSGRRRIQSSCYFIIFISMKGSMSAIALSATLAACGGGWESPNVPKTPSAQAFDLTVGNTISKTVADVANLANVANFAPTSLVMTNGTYANCTYDPATHTLTITPKAPNTEAPTDICTATFADGSGATLWPINLNLKSVDNKAPVFTSTLTTPIDITAGTAGSITLPRATDTSTVTYSMKLADGSAIPTDISFDPATSQLSWTSATTANQALSYTATDAYSNLTTMNLTTAVDHPGSASITGPATSSSWSTIQINLSATDIDGIASWSVTSQRVSAVTWQKWIVRNHVSWTGIPPATANVLAWGSVWNTEEYTLTITDNNWKVTISPLFSTTITF
jgi:large repetitive protein